MKPGAMAERDGVCDGEDTPRCMAGRVWRSVDGREDRPCLGVTGRIVVEPMIAVDEAVGLVAERQVGEGKERGDDPGGLGRNLTTIFGDLIVDPEARPGGRRCAGR